MSMKNQKNPLYIIVAVLTTIAMVATMLTMSACKSDEVEIDPYAGENISYEEAERALIKDGVSGYSALSAMMKTAEQTGSTKMTLTLTPEQYITDLLADTGMTVGKLESTTIGFGAVLENGNIFYDFSYAIGDTEIMSGDVWIDSDNLIMMIPQLLDKYVVFDLSDFNDMFNLIGGMYSMYSFADMLSLDAFGFPELPSEEAVNAVVDAMLDKYFEIAADSEVEEDVDITINEKSFNTDRTEIELTDRQLLEIALAFIKAVDACDEIKTFVQEYYDFTVPSHLTEYSYFQFDVNESVADLIEELENELDEAEEKTALTMNVFVSGTKIVKREIVTVDERYMWNEEKSIEYESTVTIINYNNKGEYFYEFIAEDGWDDSVFRISDAGSRVDSELSGRIELESKNEWSPFKTSITYSDLVFCKDGGFSASDITLSIPDMVQGERGDFKMSFRHDSFVGSFSLGGIKVASAELTFTDSYEGKPAPELNSANSVAADDLEDDDADFEKVLEAMEKAGQDLFRLFFEINSAGRLCPGCGSIGCYYDCGCPECGEEGCFYDCYPCWYCQEQDCDGECQPCWYCKEENCGETCACQWCGEDDCRLQCDCPWCDTGNCFFDCDDSPCYWCRSHDCDENC
jgi:hypothetical protein